jgi:hypothetical protein
MLSATDNNILSLLDVDLQLIVFFHKQKTNSIAWVRERTILTERPPLVGVVPTFADRWVSRSQLGGSLRP